MHQRETQTGQLARQLLDEPGGWHLDRDAADDGERRHGLGLQERILGIFETRPDRGPDDLLRVTGYRGGPVDLDGAVTVVTHAYCSWKKWVETYCGWCSTTTRGHPSAPVPAETGAAIEPEGDWALVLRQCGQ